MCWDTSHLFLGCLAHALDDDAHSILISELSNEVKVVAFFSCMIHASTAFIGMDEK